MGRTIRSPTFQPKPEKQPLWMISLKHLRTVRALLADRPPFRHSETLREAAPLDKLKVEGRTVRTPWADRTVRLSHRATHQKRKRLWTNFSTNKRTVRTPGADRPPFILKTHQRPNTSLVKKRISLRTVRAPRADRPQFTFFSPNQRNNLSGTNLRLACGPSSPQGRTVRRSTLKPTREIPFLVQL